MLIKFLVAFWAYFVLGATSIITEEAGPIAGGVAANQGRLGLMRVALAVTLGTWAAEIGLYYLGRSRGKWVRQRWPKTRRVLTRALTVVRRRPWRSSLAVRYAYGLRLTLPIACGAAHVPLYIYVIGSGVSSLTWSSLFTLLGWIFGRTATQVLAHVKRFRDVIWLATLGGVGLVLFLFLRRSGESESIEGLSGDEPSGEGKALPPPDAGASGSGEDRG